jgi:hypothetical protein
MSHTHFVDSTRNSSVSTHKVFGINLLSLWSRRSKIFGMKNGKRKKNCSASWCGRLRNGSRNRKGICAACCRRSRDENNAGKFHFGCSDQLYLLCASVHDSRMGNSVRSSRVRCLPHIMDRYVVSVSGIYCHPHDDRAKLSANTEQYDSESCFSVGKSRFFSSFCMELGISRNGPNALFSGWQWLLSKW